MPAAQRSTRAEDKVSRAKLDASSPAQDEVEFVNENVFELLKERNEQLRQKNVASQIKAPAVLPEATAKWYRDRGFANFTGPGLESHIGVLYGAYGISDEDIIEVADQVARMTKARFGKETSMTQLSEDDMKELKIAFTQTDYVGDAHVAFEKYLWRCWKEYNPMKYKSPYVAVVQSSGFGKSRMLFELARKAERSDGSSSNLRVLYSCVRFHRSTGYPVATTHLRDWLFRDGVTEEQMTSRLLAIYGYATAKWGGVQDEWIKLFTESGVDDSVTKNLIKYLRDSTDAECQVPDHATAKDECPKEKLVVLVVDEARALLCEKEGGINQFRKLHRALVKANYKIADTHGKNGGIFGVMVDTNSKISDLMPRVSADTGGEESADPSYRRLQGEGLPPFPPFVLTHTMDAKWWEYCKRVTANGADLGDEEKKEENDEVVRAENVGSQKDNDLSATIAVYKKVVTGTEDVAWHVLMRMGRPMWWSTFNEPSPRAEVIDLAACKLLLGLPPSVETYNAKTMFGVASMLCRLGVRPYSTSALASRVVADFMAVLAYVNYEKDSYLSSYASDPVLTLGAIKVWYALTNALADFILPQLKTLILGEALDTGGVGEMVARILLLLAMDKCAMRGKRFAECSLTGQFVSVDAFLKVFMGEELEIFRKGMIRADDEKAAFAEWRSQWKDWYMGFTHFVQLQLEPNEDTLWYLLGRRAAGIFPRNQNGADLLIPVFRKRSVDESAMEVDDDKVEAKVSFMLIQVKNRSPKDGGFSQSATRKLCPWFVFKDENGYPSPLLSQAVQEIIRIYMNVGEEHETKLAKFVYSSSSEDNRPKAKKVKETSEPNANDRAGGESASKQTLSDEAEAESASERAANDDVRLEDSSADADAQEEKRVFTYCFRSLSGKTYSFLDARVADRLVCMVAPLWCPMALVEGDLERRRNIEESMPDRANQTKLMPAKELMEVASQGVAYAPGHDKKAGTVETAVDTGRGLTTDRSIKKRAQKDQGGNTPKRARRHTTSMQRG
ncbi:hypothetical protein PHYBOEH_008093 [Phytophthora boehmeriae]|uniref:Uncharacterized protein n=1 Tax=Phytophthora boehmeriae TaxID=109152 RepID=A0A8T1X7E0_9STRA|nr:hypothetical protein PHYBOEH_008093 [Phytophthora boehmeriae]